MEFSPYLCNLRVKKVNKKTAVLSTLQKLSRGTIMDKDKLRFRDRNNRTHRGEIWIQYLSL